MVKRGTVIDKWTLVAPLASGGQAQVFRASGAEGDPEVAVKVVTAKHLKKKGRFRQELEAHERLSSAKAPNVMPLLATQVREHPSGAIQGFLVMPLAMLSLEDASPTLVGRYELGLEVFSGILRGVKAAHDIGIVHRDLKPRNILFLDVSLREPLVADFGICLLRETAIADRLTDEGETVGARYFMAPEQERGGVVDVTPAADIYALGKLLHYILTGRWIYREELDEAFGATELEREPRLQQVMEAILRKTVVRDPNARFQSVAELIEAVDALRPSNGNGPNGGASLANDEPASPTIDQLPKQIEPRIERDYRNMMLQSGAASSPPFLLMLDEMRRGFRREWSQLYEMVKDSPADAPQVARALVCRQTQPIALALALGRSNDVTMFPAFQHFIEATARDPDPKSGYEAILTIPHVLGGFMYMAASVQALTYQSWDVLTLLLNEKFEWFYRSGRPLHSYGFDMAYFFHPEALERQASKTHDFYRSLFESPSLESILTDSGEDIKTAYIQAQFLMSLRVAQEAERGNADTIWPDFGRFYAARLFPLLDRVASNQSYGRGIAMAFAETREQFLEKLNPRITYLRANCWSGSTYLWNSLRDWAPRH